MSRMPEYRLKILNKVTDKRNNDAGAGWVNKDGSISVILNPGIALTDNSEYVYTLLSDPSNKNFPDEANSKYHSVSILGPEGFVTLYLPFGIMKSFFVQVFKTACLVIS